MSAALVDPAPVRTGVVVIGRNEGERLQVCLEKLSQSPYPVCYVDSGSSDGSPELADDLTDLVERLDPTQPFTAARGRNRGLEILLEAHPYLEYVHVFDGDTEVEPGWLEFAIEALDDDYYLGAVCGRRRERHRDTSPYNTLCDMEWDTPVGESDAFGGDALIRVAAWQDAGGYDEHLIAGEDPEFSYRLRRKGWKIGRLDHPMTIHDANITSFSQWYTRSRRAGHAYAEGFSMHGSDDYYKRQLRSIAFWGGVIPSFAAGSAILSLFDRRAALGLGVLGLYPVLWKRAHGHRREIGDNSSDSSTYATSIVVGKFAELSGVLLWFANRLRGRQSSLVEYKR